MDYRPGLEAAALMCNMDMQAWKRRLIKAVLQSATHWSPLRSPREGFSIVLGAPWALRHLLGANLRFVAKTDLTGLDRILVVFDRTRRQAAEEVIGTVTRQFPDLPLEFHFHPPVAGGIVRLADQSKFYASLNWVTGIAHCRTRYAVMHDFDLYPTDAGLFVTIVETMSKQGLRFSGAEYTHFDGLTDADGLIGTWELGVDVQWIRANYRPVDCFHAVAPVNGRRVDLDAFSLIQSKTPLRSLPGSIGRNSYAHVTNLCSTYLRYNKGEKVAVAWRLHYLWYLESLDGGEDRLKEVVDAMRNARCGELRVRNCTADFSQTHVTCANVLRDELRRMERVLHGSCRPCVSEYIDTFEAFLARFGENTALGTTARGWAEASSKCRNFQ